MFDPTFILEWCEAMGGVDAYVGCCVRGLDTIRFC